MPRLLMICPAKPSLQLQQCPKKAAPKMAETSQQLKMSAKPSQKKQKLLESKQLSLTVTATASTAESSPWLTPLAREA